MGEKVYTLDYKYKKDYTYHLVGSDFACFGQKRHFLTGKRRKNPGWKAGVCFCVHPPEGPRDGKPAKINGFPSGQSWHDFCYIYKS